MNETSSLTPNTIEKKFSDLLVGDRIRTIAKITNIKSDQSNTIPKWYLLYLFDGTKTIRIFFSDISTYKIGDYLELEFSVKEGKPWNGNPQLAYDLHYVSKADKPIKTLSPKKTHKRNQKIDKNGVIQFLRKDELKEIETGAIVQFYTKIRTLNPKDGIRQKNQKILLSDLENKPIGLWIPRTELPVFEAINEGEYFVVNATVKKTHDNQFLVFLNLIRGTEAQNSSIAQKFFEQRIKYYSHELGKYLKWVTQITKDHELLAERIESFNQNLYGE